MLDQDVVVIAFGWLQGGITNDYLGKGSSVWIDLAGGHNVREIGPRDTNPKDTAKICVLLNPVLHLNAGQNVHVAGAAIDRRGWQDVPASVLSHLLCQVAGIGCLKANAALQAQFAEPDSVHHEPGIDALVSIKISGQ